MKRRWWSWGTRVVPSCGLRQPCGLQRPLLPPPRGGWRPSPRAAGWGQVAPGLVRDQVVRGADVAGNGVRGRRGAAVPTEGVWLGWAPVIYEGVCISAHGGEQIAQSAVGCRGGRA